MTEDLSTGLERIERRLLDVTRDLAHLREQASAGAAATALAEPPPAAVADPLAPPAATDAPAAPDPLAPPRPLGPPPALARRPVGEPIVPGPLGAPSASMRRQAAAAAEPGAPARPAPRPSRSLLELIDARALSLVGGVVTLLGILFVYVLASRRGWVTDEMRVGFGAAVSTGLLVAALRLYDSRRRAEAALVAAGVAIAGYYVTLFAATVVYDLASRQLALLVAAAIAAGGTALALRWRQELVAHFGLLGAAFMPLLVGRLTPASLLFVLVLLTAAVALMLRRGWDAVFLAVGGAAALQLAALLVGDVGAPRWAEPVSSRVLWAELLTCAAFWVVAVAAGIGRSFAGRSADLPVPTVAALSVSAGLALWAPVALVGGTLIGERRASLAILLAGAAYLALAAAVARLRPPSRDLVPLVAAIGFALVAVGLADVLVGPARVWAFAAQAVLLAWLARRLGDGRAFAGSLAYLGVALAETLGAEAGPELLALVDAEAIRGVPSLLACVLAAAAVTASCRDADGRRVGAWATGGLVLYTVSLAVVGVAEALAGPRSLDDAFRAGHTLVSGLWAVAGLTLLWLGLRRRGENLRSAGLVLFGLALAKLFLFDLANLASLTRAGAFIAVGSLLLAAGAVYSRFAEHAPPGERDEATAPGTPV